MPTHKPHWVLSKVCDLIGFDMEWHFWYWFDIEAWHLVKVCLKSSTQPITQHLDIDYCATIIHSIGEMASTNATHTHKLRRNKCSNHRSVHRVLGMSVNWFVYGVENYNYPNIDNDAIQVNRIVVSILFVYVFFFVVPFRELARFVCVCVCFMCCTWQLYFEPSLSVQFTHCTMYTSYPLKPWTVQ